MQGVKPWDEDAWEVSGFVRGSLTQEIQRPSGLGGVVQGVWHDLCQHLPPATLLRRPWGNRGHPCNPTLDMQVMDYLRDPY